MFFVTIFPGPWSIFTPFIAILLLDKTGVNKVHYGQGENG